MVNCHFLSEKDHELLLTTESVMNIKINKSYENKMFNLNFDASTLSVDYTTAGETWGRFIDQYLNQYLQEGLTKLLTNKMYSILPESVKMGDNFIFRFIENRGLLFIFKRDDEVTKLESKFIVEEKVRYLK